MQINAGSLVDSSTRISSKSPPSQLQVVINKGSLCKAIVQNAAFCMICDNWGGIQSTVKRAKVYVLEEAVEGVNVIGTLSCANACSSHWL